MLLPVEYAWAEQVLIASIVVFFFAWIGNTITFSNRVISAFVTALVFAIIFGALVYFGYGGVQMSVSTEPSPTAPATLRR
ncbi:MULTISPECIES: hypothetical protein [Rhodomicrobium]|uniref:hypothetical protein n=1 Tax=Rhodomicrobium TaxID=1068 RepID=UPI001FDA6008|nr:MULTISPECIES: hypothetical protein [Rhodomicrobium]